MKKQRRVHYARYNKDKVFGGKKEKNREEQIIKKIDIQKSTKRISKNNII